MNFQKRPNTGIINALRLTCLAIIPLTVATNPSHAQYVVNDNNSSINFNVSHGLTSWFVDGQNQLAQQTFFYRIGGGQEYRLDNITATPVISQSGNNIEVTYANASFGIKLSYTLGGYASGTGRSGATLGVNVINYQPNQLDLHLFQYTDFDLGGVLGGQSLNFLTALGKYNRAAQTGAGVWMTNTFVGTALPSPIPLVEAGLYDSTLTSLTDLAQTTFNSSSTTAGPGDVTYGIQYNLLLNPNESFALSELISMQVPEPTTAGLISVAGIALALRNLNRKKS